MVPLSSKALQRDVDAPCKRLFLRGGETLLDDRLAELNAEKRAGVTLKLCL